MLAFPKNRGLRIDHILLSPPLAARCTASPHRPQRAQGREALGSRAGDRRVARRLTCGRTRRRRSGACSPLRAASRLRAPMVFASPIFLFLFLPLDAGGVLRAAAARGATACCSSRASRSTRGARRRTSRWCSARSRSTGDRRARSARAADAARAQALARRSAIAGNLARARGLQVRELRRRERQRARAGPRRSRRSRWRRSRCRSASRSSRSTRSRTSSTSTSATRDARAQPAALRALHPAVPAADRRTDHPLARHRRRSSPRATQRLADFAYGVRRFVLGLGKKVLIANTLGRVGRPRSSRCRASELTTPLAWLGLVCYTLQIYFDFSGYSDMAIGLMRMFGFRILENFNYPYIARSIREFWRRWHISLSNWFRDYLYIPLGGNQRGERRAYANLVIVFLLCGLWHGASWPFVLWGVWHGAVPRRRARRPRPRARAASARCAHVVRAARGDGRLGAVPLRHARAGGRLLRGARSGAATAIRRAIRSPSILDPLRRGHARRRHRVRHAARAAHRRMARSRAPRERRRGALVLAADVAWLAARVRRSPARCSPPAPTIRSSTSASDDMRARRSARAAAGAAAGARDASAARSRSLARRVFALALALVAWLGALVATRTRASRASRIGATRAVARRRALSRDVRAGVRARVRRPLRRPRRARCASITAALLSRVRRVASLPTVMLGRDGWLYWLGEDGQSLDRHYRGTLPFRRRDVDGDGERAQAPRSDCLASRGIAYVVVDRARQVHDLSGAPARRGSRDRRRPTPYDRSCATRCARDGRVAFVDLRAPLLAAKARERVYYKTDSHWNFNGAIVGYDAMMRAVQQALRRTSCRRSRRASGRRTMPGVDFYSGDLLQHARHAVALREDDVAPLAKVLGDTTRAARRRIDKDECPRLRVLRLRQARAAARGRLRDSMAIPLIPLLSENFSRVVYVQLAQARSRADRAREARHRDRGNGRALAARAGAADADAARAKSPAASRYSLRPAAYARLKRLLAASPLRSSARAPAPGSCASACCGPSRATPPLPCDGRRCARARGG